MEWDDPTFTRMPKPPRNRKQADDEPSRDYQTTAAVRVSRLPWILLLCVVLALALSSVWWWLHLDQQVARIAVLTEELNDQRKMSEAAEAQLVALKKSTSELTAKVEELNLAKAALEQTAKAKPPTPAAPPAAKPAAPRKQVPTPQRKRRR
jgi:cytoskeletal protein RodZ